jgi:hypothetical protein
MTHAQIEERVAKLVDALEGPENWLPNALLRMATEAVTLREVLDLPGEGVWALLWRTRGM